MTLKTTSVAVVKSMQLPRKPEFDALRGLFLVWMTLTHLPTRLSDLVNQPFGFVSSAEGFVFLSALLVGRVYMRQALENAGSLRGKLWKRALRVYAYHVSLLLLAFTFAAAFAVYRHHAALEHLLDFYIAHPAVAIVGSLLLIYCPPLLDILPIYVIFLLASPFAFSIAVKRSWGPVIAGSTIIWLLAQFGLRAAVQHYVVSVTHLPIPLQEWGAFNLFAWQWIWIMGMWMGARSVEGELPLHVIPKWVIGIAAACLRLLSRSAPRVVGTPLDTGQPRPAAGQMAARAAARSEYHRVRLCALQPARGGAVGHLTRTLHHPGTRFD